MTQKVGIVDYGIAGNILNIAKALENAQANIQILKGPSEFKNVSKLVIPGVGSFSDGMKELKESGMTEEILKFATSQKPVLGICLGMQILASIGFEYGETEGLKLVRGEVRPMRCKHVVPHMGFNTLRIIGKSPLFEKVDEVSSYYFMHSFEFINYTDIIALTEYSGYEFVSAVQHNNIFGVQFHPEKSREAGIQVFKNFLNI
ncbi:MAG: imidazole glycerol phosphate synthase subunit HisH [Nitrosomonadaceae bacterium]|nr:imidazole glycerol phosphate synthase subunit HisH [Nitrosomonadaceae bacterium]|tara:strand:- start:342 stop:950 length:609 start_codon:yes stop_codon:yes gene_type:complete